MSKDSNLVILSEFYQGIRTDLSPAQQLMKMKVEMAGQMLLKYRKKSLAVRHLTGFQFSDGFVDRRMAYKYMAVSETLIGQIEKYDKEVLRIQVINQANDDIKQAKKMAKWAWEHKKISAWEKARKVIDKAELRIIKVSGLDKEDPDLPDYEKLEQHVFEIVLDEVSKSKLDQFAKGNSVNLNDLDTEDVDHEEI